MPAIEIDLKELSKVIKTLNKTETETLLLFLSETAEELLKRKQKLESHDLKALSLDEVFDVWRSVSFFSGQKRPEKNE